MFAVFAKPQRQQKLFCSLKYYFLHRIRFCEVSLKLGTVQKLPGGGGAVEWASKGEMLR